MAIQVYWLLEFGPYQPNNIGHYAQDKYANTLVYDQPPETKLDRTWHIVFSIIYWQYDTACQKQIGKNISRYMEFSQEISPLL